MCSITVYLDARRQRDTGHYRGARSRFIAGDQRVQTILLAEAAEQHDDKIGHSQSRINSQRSMFYVLMSRRIFTIFLASPEILLVIGHQASYILRTV
jgi:hypothetical protein